MPIDKDEVEGPMIYKAARERFVKGADDSGNLVSEALSLENLARDI
jgi:hypothetical protein